jgi:hypothetical protein
MIAMTDLSISRYSSPPAEKPAPPHRSWRDRLITDLHFRICALLTLGLIVMPPEGIQGVELCMFKNATKLPCPGCGLTRCGSNLVRGNVARAIDYNPFGLVIIPAMAGIGVMAVLPRRWREGVRRFSAAHKVAFNRLLLVFTVCFVLFGLLRSLGVRAGWLQFPANWL